MNDSVQIVKPAIEEWEGFRDVVLRSLKDSPQAFLNTYEEAASVPEDKWKNRIAGSLRGEVGVTLIAKHNGKIVGLVGVQFLQHVKMRHVAHVWGSYVDPEFRGLGIGRKLMDGIIGMSQAHPGIKKIKIEVIAEQLSAFELYKKLGFQLIGVSHGDLCVDGNYYDEILMEMML
ncbi:MAG: GNAT family N-acetyltransferase [bacterium]|nr:GNAT family N-acetyltransferase [bacterium]